MAAGIALIIFDCDGVLIDSETIAAQVHADALAELGHAYTPEDVIRRFVGVSSRDMRRILEDEAGGPLPKDYGARPREALAALYATELRAVPYIAEATDEIGLPACVASSTSPDTLRL